MASSTIIRHKLRNVFQTVIILLVMFSLFIAVGFFLSGTVGMLWALFFGLMMWIISPRISPQVVLRMYGAIPLHPSHAPGLYSITRELAERAQIMPPRLYYIPTAHTNAFSVGTMRNSAIAISDGLLRRLNAREITVVLAHEISHIRHGDLKIMNLADAISKFTDVFSSIGIFLLLLYIPLSMMMDVIIPLSIILLLMCAPTCSALLQLALSRSREYDADLGAVELTGDPLSLASALKKLEYYPIRIFDFLPFPKRRDAVPSILRTHPVTQKRIDRLIELAQIYTPKRIALSDSFLHFDFVQPIQKRSIFSRILRF